MGVNQRFVINENHEFIDSLNFLNSRKGWFVDDPKDESHLRECILWQRLCDLLDKLIINLRRPEKDWSGKEYQPPNKELLEIRSTVFDAIKASHLNSFEPTMSIEHRFVGTLKREMKRTRNFTSLSLFLDDLEYLLRDLYGDIDSEALDSVLRAVFSILSGYTKYVRTDLWKEHTDAQAMDYMLGIGVQMDMGLAAVIIAAEWQQNLI
jgi:hypothetical protein